MTGEPMLAQPLSARSAMFNPIVGNYKTSDDRWITLMMLQSGRYWPDFCRHIDREDLIADPRFESAEKLMANAAEASAVLSEVIGARPFAEWVERFRTLEEQWASVQNSLEVGNDQQLRANGYISEVIDADGN